MNSSRAAALSRAQLEISPDTIYARFLLISSPRVHSVPQGGVIERRYRSFNVRPSFMTVVRRGERVLFIVLCGR